MPAPQTINIAVPMLSIEDYPQFGRICAGLPPTYAKWLFNQRQYHRRHHRSRYKLISVPIDPAGFEKYCAREHCSSTADALYCLAQEKMDAKPAQRRRR